MGRAGSMLPVSTDHVRGVRLPRGAFPTAWINELQEFPFDRGASLTTCANISEMRLEGPLTPFSAVCRP